MKGLTNPPVADMLGDNDAKGKAPRLWALTENKTITSFEAWRSNMAYSMSLNPDFVEFCSADFTWSKKRKGVVNSGLQAMGNRTAAQRVAALEVMLQQIVCWAPHVAGSCITKTATSLNEVWQVIRKYYGIQQNGSYLSSWAEFILEPGESYENLYHRLYSFVEDNLLERHDDRTHHGEQAQEDEEISQSFESVLVIHWLYIIHPLLPRAITNRFATELRNKTIASIKDQNFSGHSGHP